ncbi:hypothetical protein [Aeromicrobium sp. CF3.5]|uniref:hypothetical protein n=1 Tax=Aeromicrobium sp. CF3.5 TaxID=3373078 RepID=UPI003EE43955
MKLLRLVPLAAAGLLLSSCGALTPGAAATVDNRTISMSALDDSARIYCDVTALQAQQQGVQAIDNAAIRQQAVTDLVLERVATEIAEQRDIAVPTPVKPDPAQFAEVFGDRAPEVADVLAQAQDLFQLLAQIGGDETSTEVTDQNRDQLAEAGRTVALESFSEFDVEFSPRLGLSDDGQPAPQIGSLSVTATPGTPAVEDLPEALRCS